MNGGPCQETREVYRTQLNASNEFATDYTALIRICCLCYPWLIEYFQH